MDPDGLHERLRLIDERLRRMEERLGLPPLSTATPSAAAPERGTVTPGTPAVKTPLAEDELEFELGQNWFAKAGIVVLALGMAFLLTFPYTELPPAAPGILGYLLAGSLFLGAGILRKSFDLVSRYLRGAGMVLLFFTTLRLFYFGPEPVMQAGSPYGILLLLGVLLLNVLVAVRRISPYLFSIALTTGYATAVAVGSDWFVLSMIVGMALLTVAVALRAGWTGVLAYATVLTYLTHLVWALNNPFAGNPAGFVTGPAASLWFLLLYALVLSIGVLFRPDRKQEGIGVIMASFLNGGGSYGVFLLHSAAAFPMTMVGMHLAASALLLALAIAFWMKERSRFSTFAYVMLGYMALSVAIIKSTAIPEMFVWLSVQSLIVVATAIWFRSRFIVVANFAIYLLIVIGYVVVGGEESGISIGIGVVALASARILRWQQDRLELKTEMMRNAYLATGFLIFPYSTYHLVAGEYVALSWVGIAGMYYLMNLIIRSPKYRWMGHLTLLGTVLYVVVIGIAQLGPTYRIVSFLVLGTVLLVGSLIFTRLRSKKGDAGDQGPA